MARYDWGWSRGYDRGFDYNVRRGRGYGSDFGRWGTAWGSAPSAGYAGRGVGLYRNWGTPWEAGPGYDRDVYGGSHPTYGGYPGGRERGMYYGGRGGYGRDYGRMGGARGYDRGYAREPFLPEEAYQRHPDYDRPQEHMRGRWPASGHDFGAGETDIGDDEVRQAVRQNLYNDGWVDADSIQVEVNDGVVTLTGQVADYMEARYAWDDAWESAGVRGVVNQLTVRLDQPREASGEVLPQTEGGKKAPAGKKS